MRQQHSDKYEHTHTHTLTLTHTKQKSKEKSLAATKRSCQPSEAMGRLGTTQALKASAAWGRASTPQVGLYHAQDDGVGTQSPTWATPITGHPPPIPPPHPTPPPHTHNTLHKTPHHRQLQCPLLI